MANFVHIPPLHIGRSEQWVLDGVLIYQSDIELDGKPVRVVVPPGFETDLASIPDIVPNYLIPRNGRHRLPAIVHDYLVRNLYSGMKRSVADQIFREAMGVCNVPAWRRWVMWAAVRGMTFVKGNPTGD